MSKGKTAAIVAGAIGGLVILAGVGASLETSVERATSTTEAQISATTTVYVQSDANVVDATIAMLDDIGELQMMCDLLHESAAYGLPYSFMFEAFADGYGNDPSLPSAADMFDAIVDRCL